MDRTTRRQYLQAPAIEMASIQPHLIERVLGHLELRETDGPRQHDHAGKVAASHIVGSDYGVGSIRIMA